MMSPNKKGHYRKFFDFDLRSVSMSIQTPERRFRKDWDNPGGHHPYAVEYWCEPSAEVGSRDVFQESYKEWYPIGKFFIRWRDNVGAFITQEFPMYFYIYDVNIPGSALPPPETPKQYKLTVACSNIKNIPAGEFCGLRVEKLYLDYDKTAWGCMKCIQRKKMIYDYPLEESTHNNEWLYDRILGITDGHHQPPEGLTEVPDALADDSLAMHKPMLGRVKSKPEIE